MKIPAPGADVVPVPAPLDQEPAPDSFCDLVMTGGVASGVVYPWAVVELARAYRFRSIGGTSVGAMAAALAAAAEYGRRTGVVGSFETLRRLPAALAEPMPGGLTRMLSLFQPAPAGRRLFALVVLGLRRLYPHDAAESDTAPVTCPRIAWAIVQAYLREILITIVVAALAYVLVLGVTWLLSLAAWRPTASAVVVSAVSAVLIGLVIGVIVGMLRDVRNGIVDNNLGFCKGGDVPDAARGHDDDGWPALTTWLHQGIQAGSGRGDNEAPLTFRHLWSAPAFPGDPFTAPVDDAPPSERAINLEVITTNLSHGRPYRLPLVDEATRLFFRPDELRSYFPASVLAFLVASSRRYAPATDDEPPAQDYEGCFQLPGADLPVVVAARMSLSFPVLFSAVPLYAIQPGTPTQPARLRRCWFSDGGICSNFPIHLFDAAIPRWPTFGMWLGTRKANPGGQAIWLPERPEDGSQDCWAGAGLDGGGLQRRGWFGHLINFLGDAVTTAKDWSDITTMRLPHMRCRIARLGLRPNEGALNIAMPRRQILRMADEYGTRTGRLFRARYESRDSRTSTLGWREQRWVRFQVVRNALSDFFDGLADAADAAPRSRPLDEAIADARSTPPLRGSRTLAPAQAAALEEILTGLRTLESVMDTNDVPQPPLNPNAEIRSRPPL